MSVILHDSNLCSLKDGCKGKNNVLMCKYADVQIELFQSAHQHICTSAHYKWDGVAGAGFYDVALLYFFPFLNAGWQVEAAFCALIGLGRADEDAVANDYEFF